MLIVLGSQAPPRAPRAPLSEAARLGNEAVRLRPQKGYVCIYIYIYIYRYMYNIYIYIYKYLSLSLYIYIYK